MAKKKKSKDAEPAKAERAVSPKAEQEPSANQENADAAPSADPVPAGVSEAGPGKSEEGARMQWHPLLYSCLKKLLPSDACEIETEKPVGEIPRRVDMVIYHKDANVVLPGLWANLRTCNAIEFKSPSVGAQVDDLACALELTLGIHRRENARRREKKLPKLKRRDVACWYLARFGKNWLKKVKPLVINLVKIESGVWRATVFGHPCFLVRYSGLKLNEGTLLFRLFELKNQQSLTETAEFLLDNPGAMAKFGSFFAIFHPNIWRTTLVTRRMEDPLAGINFQPFIQEFGLASIIQHIGLKNFLDAAGPKAVVEELGLQNVIQTAGLQNVIQTAGPKAVVDELGLQNVIQALELEYAAEDMPAEQLEQLSRLVHSLERRAKNK